MKVLLISIGNPSPLNRETPVLKRHIKYSNQIDGLIFQIYNDIDCEYKKRIISNNYSIYNARSNNKIILLVKYFLIGYKLISKHKIRLIITQDPFITGFAGIILSKIFKINMICNLHASFIDNKYWISEKPILYSLLNSISKRVLKNSSGIKTVCNEDKDYLQNILPEKKIISVNTPIELNNFKKKLPYNTLIKLRGDLGLAKDDIVLIWVGRIVPQKRIFLMLSNLDPFFKKYSKLKLLLIGKKTDIKEVKLLELINKYKSEKKIVWLENGIPNNSLSSYYQSSDIFITFSSYEGLAKTILEASASSLPVITTNVTGVNQSVINNTTGLISEIDDHHQWGLNIEKLILNQNKRVQMGNNGFNYIHNEFSYQKSIDRIISFWKNNYQ